MSRQPWALILGASSGFGAATAYELARHGMNIFGVHLDRRDTLPRVQALGERIRACGREVVFFNGNAADEERRRGFTDAIAARLADASAPGVIRVLLHSLAFGALKPLTGEGAVTKKQLELTCDVMGHSLVAWVQDVVSAGLMEAGGRVFAMTSGAAPRPSRYTAPWGRPKPCWRPTSGNWLWSWRLSV